MQLKSTPATPARSRIKNTVMHNGKRHVCRIFDAGPEMIDRYTVAFKGHYLKAYGMVYPYLAASSLPFHPQGFGQHGEAKQFLTGKHLGRRIRFEDAPTDVQKFICQNLS